MATGLSDSATVLHSDKAVIAPVVHVCSGLSPEHALLALEPSQEFRVFFQ